LAVTVTIGSDTVAPVSAHNYDGLWHTANFQITLTATDAGSGVKEKYYKINGGAQQVVSVNGQPVIAYEGGANTLEYWSVDNSNNEELPHKFLSAIKLDKSQPSISISDPALFNIGPDKIIFIAQHHASLKGQVTDSLSGAGSVDILINGDIISPALDAGGSFISARTFFQDGPSAITATAYDIAGNQNQYAFTVFSTVPVACARLTVGSKDSVVVNFGPSYGIWALNNDIWSQVHPVSALSMAVGNFDSDARKDLVIDFGSPYGIWTFFNGTTWSQLRSISARQIVTGDTDGDGKDDIIIDFGSSYGIWVRYYDGTWAQLHTISPEQIVTGDINGDGKEEIIIDFGSSYGIWIRYYDGTWAQLHTISPEQIVIGDINGDGKEEIIIDFGSSYGIWVRYYDGIWSQLHAMSPECIAKGDIDGNGICDLVFDFGTTYGIWALENSTTWHKLHDNSPWI
jgi:hypothetical protein